jgi:hypothetical protein
VKKRLALVVAAATALAGLGSLAAFADTINTPYANVNIDPHSAIWFDGAESNPAPLSGYLVFHTDGRVSCGTTDGPDAGHTPQNLFIENGCSIMGMLPSQAQVGGGPGVMIPNLPAWPGLPTTPVIPGFSWPAQLPAPQLPVLPKVPGATVNLKNMPTMPNMPSVGNVQNQVPGAEVKLHDMPKLPGAPTGLPSGARIIGAVPSKSGVVSTATSALSTATSKLPVGVPAAASTLVSQATTTLSFVTSGLPVHLPSI